MTIHAPKIPQPEAVTVDPNKTALLVLDLFEGCNDADGVCRGLLPRLTNVLDRARVANVFIIYTVPFSLKGALDGQVYSGLERRPSEPVIYPDGFDKFTSGELQGLLAPRNIDTLIITGYRSNICVLYTATKAARELHYRIIIPMDGIAAITDYEQKYTLFQFTVLPGRASRQFTFTTLDMITFQ